MRRVRRSTQLRSASWATAASLVISVLLPAAPASWLVAAATPVFPTGTLASIEQFCS
jgi:hypothetical protein